MSSKLKTMAIAATIALSVGLFAVQAAHAGGRHHIPLGALGAYAAGDDYDESYLSSYGCEVCGYDEETVGAAAAAAVAAGAASRVLGVDVEDVIDLVDE